MGINISIVAGKDGSISTVKAQGTIQHVITDDERKAFKISPDEVLKSYINRYFGKAPDDVFLHSPTPWDDLYKRYNWTEVQIVLVVKSAEILGITSKPLILSNTPLVNNSSKKGTFHADLHETVIETVTSSWNTGGTLSVGETIEVSCEFLGVGAKGSTSLSYSQSWGIGGEKSQSIEVGSDAGVEVELDPGESVVALLSASQGVMKVRIRFNAYLIGHAALNYGKKFKDHHFWALPITNIMNGVGLTNSVLSVEDMEINYYCDSKVELIDQKTGVPKSTYKLTDLPRMISLPKALAGN